MLYPSFHRYGQDPSVTKKIFRLSGQLDLLDEGDAVMADKGFVIRDLLTFKKVHLVSPAYCRGPRLSAKGTTHTCRVASLRTHVERNILKLKQFRIFSVVIPLLLKPMLERIIFVCAALTNLCPRSTLYCSNKYPFTCIGKKNASF